MEILGALIFIVAWAIGTYYLFCDKHWVWGIFSIIFPIIGIVYFVYRLLPRR